MIVELILSVEICKPNIAERAMRVDVTSKKGIGVTYHTVGWKRREAERGVTDWRYTERSQGGGIDKVKLYT